MRQLGPPPQLKGTATSSPAQGPTPCPNPLRQAEAGKRRVSFFSASVHRGKRHLRKVLWPLGHDQLCGVERGRTAFS